VESRGRGNGGVGGGGNGGGASNDVTLTTSSWFPYCRVNDSVAPCTADVHTLI
jgi:hypothetical protein